jgi:4'-phosphopantetheinyl transferase
MLLAQLNQEIHVWIVTPDAIRDKKTLDSCIEILSEQEREQYRRFRFPEDSHHYLVSHALVRRALSKYIDISPGEWAFYRSEHGRPEVANPGLPSIRFNLSHTKGLAACVVTSSCDCGIDVERIYARHNPIGVAKRMFSSAEYQYMLQLKGREQLVYFFTRWTLREAYVKARGIGISFPTSKLNFNIESSCEITIEFQADIQDNSEDWQLQLLPLTEEHMTAVAIRRQDHNNKNLITYFVADDLDSYVDINLPTDPD